MKLGPVTKLKKSNKIRSKDFEDDNMSANSDVIVNFLIYNQFGAIRIPDSGSIACKTYLFISSNLLSCKNWKQNKKISNTHLTLFPLVKVLFWPKNADFLQKNADIGKIKNVLVLSDIFFETTYFFVLTYQILSF